MSFSVGFADEIEKLALRLPSPQEMLSSAASGQTSARVPQPDAAPAPAASPEQHLHVHVHGGGAKGGGAKPKAPAALPKPPQDAPRPVEGSQPASDQPFTGLPSAPSFGADSKAAPKTYASTGRTPGRHTAGKPAAAGEQLPSQMNLGPRWIQDTGEGPTRDAVMTPKDILGGIAQASKPAQMAPGQNSIPTTPIKDNSYGGLEYGRTRVEPPLAKSAPAPQATPASAGGQKFDLQSMAPPATKPKKKMFGVALAGGNEPAKI